MRKPDVVRPLTVEGMVIEGQRKLSYEATSRPEAQVEIIPSAELFLDICKRLIALESEIEGQA